MSLSNGGMKFVGLSSMQPCEEIVCLSDDEDDDGKQEQAESKKNSRFRMSSSFEDDDSETLEKVALAIASMTRVSNNKAGPSKEIKSTAKSSSSSAKSSVVSLTSDSEDEFDRILFDGAKKKLPKKIQPKRKSSDAVIGEASVSFRQFHPISDSDSDTAPPPKKTTKVPVARNKTKTINVLAGSQSPLTKAKKGRKGKYTDEERAAMAAEKLAKQRQREERRRMNPDNCLKYIIMEVDSGLVGIQALQVFLQSPPINEIQHEVKDGSVPFSVNWQRELAPDENGKCDREMATTMIQLLEMHMVEPLVSNGQLVTHVKSILKANRILDRFTMIIFGSKQYFTIRKKKNDGRITKDELQDAITECQLELGISFRMLENAQEVSEWLFRYTKAVAKEPFKKLQNTWQDNFRFHLASEKSNNIKDGLPTVWLKTLSKFRRAPIEACQAIASLYSTPATLLLAYENCETVEEAKSLLEDIVMHRGVGALATQRRVGPALSRRIHAVFTSDQPDLLLSEFL